MQVRPWRLTWEIVGWTPGVSLRTPRPGSSAAPAGWDDDPPVCEVFGNNAFLRRLLREGNSTHLGARLCRMVSQMEQATQRLRGWCGLPLGISFPDFSSCVDVKGGSGAGRTDLCCAGMSGNQFRVSPKKLRSLGHSCHQDRSCHSTNKGLHCCSLQEQRVYGVHNETAWASLQG